MKAPHRCRRALALGARMLLAAFGSIWVASSTSAQPAADTSTGDAYDSLPGLVETRVATERPRRVALSIAGGYGYTEALHRDDASHHRVPMALSAAGFVLPQLALSLRVDGRYDRHRADGYGADSGEVISSQLGVRGAGQLSDTLTVGGQVTGIVVGTHAAASGFDALSFDATALVAYRPLAALTLALDAGYLLDRSGGAYRAGAPVRRGDYVAWGVSDYDAILLRGGGSYRVHELELVAELASRLLVGASTATKLSSIHANGGVRYHLDRRFQLTATAQLELGKRPNIGPDPSPRVPFVPHDALVVIDPRVVVQVGFRYSWEPEVKKAALPVVVPEPEPPAVPQTRVLEGRVVDDAGQAVSDAVVQLVVGEAVFEQHTSSDGRYRFDAVPPGEGTVRVTTHGFTPVEVPLTPLGVPDPVRLQAAHVGGLLQGLVRKFNGTPVQGKIVVRPSNIEVVADADGRFRIELAPGDYQVEVRAPGLRHQVRRMSIREGSVTILNVDLYRR